MARCLSGCFAVQVSSGLVKIHVNTAVLIMRKCVKDIVGGLVYFCALEKAQPNPKKESLGSFTFIIT